MFCLPTFLQNLSSRESSFGHIISKGFYLQSKVHLAIFSYHLTRDKTCFIKDSLFSIFSYSTISIQLFQLYLWKLLLQDWRRMVSVYLWQIQSRVEVVLALLPLLLCQLITIWYDQSNNKKMFFLQEQTVWAVSCGPDTLRGPVLVHSWASHGPLLGQDAGTGMLYIPHAPVDPTLMPDCHPTSYN